MTMRNAAAMVVLAVVCVSATKPPEHRDHTQHKAIAALQAAEEPQDIARSCHRLFTQASEEGLRGFLAHADHGVALAAGWERVRRTIPTIVDEEAYTKPDRTAVSRFLGLVEGRLQMSLPPVWEAALRAASSNGRENIWFAWPYDKAATMPAVHGDDAQEIRRVESRREGDRYLVTVGDKTWTLPYADIGRGVFVELAGDTTFVALYEDTATPYQLYAIDEESGKVRWEADVWAGTVPTGGTGLSWHNVEVRVHGNEVVVFGVSGNAAYVETFDVKTGKSLCRFGTGYFEFDEPAERGLETSESRPEP